MKNNYCLMNVNGKIESNGSSMWEMCVLSESGDIIYPTNIFIESINLCEAIEIAEKHIDIHKEVWDEYGSIKLNEEVLIRKIDLL